jgi:hypothetical protein
MPLLFGHAERSLAGHRQGVWIGAGVEEHPHQCDIPLVGRQVQGRIPGAIRDVDIRTALDEEFCDVGLPSGQGGVQRGIAIAVTGDGREVGAVLEQDRGSPLAVVMNQAGRILAMRAITRTAVTNEVRDWIMKRALAHSLRGIVSVGLKAAAFVNDV